MVGVRVRVARVRVTRVRVRVRARPVCVSQSAQPLVRNVPGVREARGGRRRRARSVACSRRLAGGVER
jgi:hypothetical protein